MKWKMFGVAALAAVAVSAHAQESRQEVSISGTGLFPPSIPATSGDGVSANGDSAAGGLASYRYNLTPRSALEVNYQYLQTVFGFESNTSQTGQVHSRMQEISGAYVYSRNYGNFNPFVEAGVGGYVFTPIIDSQTSSFSPRQNTNVGALYGAGLAYEISPSFDIRAEYRGIIVKYPSFNIGTSGTAFRTNRYANFSDPAIGIAYHF